MTKPMTDEELKAIRERRNEVICTDLDDVQAYRDRARLLAEVDRLRSIVEVRTNSWINTTEALEISEALRKEHNSVAPGPRLLGKVDYLEAECARLRRLDKLAREWLKAEEAWLATDDGTKEDIELSKASVAARYVYRAAIESEGKDK